MPITNTIAAMQPLRLRYLLYIVHSMWSRHKEHNCTVAAGQRDKDREEVMPHFQHKEKEPAGERRSHTAINDLHLKVCFRIIALFIIALLT